MDKNLSEFTAQSQALRYSWDKAELLQQRARSTAEERAQLQVRLKEAAVRLSSLLGVHCAPNTYRWTIEVTVPNHNTRSEDKLDALERRLTELETLTNT